MNSGFYITKVGGNEYPLCSVLLNQWKDNTTDYDSQIVYEHMAEALKTAKPSVFTDVYACKDSDDKIRSIALIKFDDLYSKNPNKTKKFLKITYIATSPNFKRQGTGTILMNYLSELSLKNRTCGVYLNSVGSAQVFYEKKMSFKPLAAPLFPYDERHDGPFPMLLSAEKIQQLQERNAGPKVAKLPALLQIS